MSKIAPSQREVIEILRTAVKDRPRDKPVVINAGDVRLLIEVIDQLSAPSPALPAPGPTPVTDPED